MVTPDDGPAPTPRAKGRPRPEDPDFFARFTLSAGVLEYAFGPAGGTPPPRRTTPPTKAADK